MPLFSRGIKGSLVAGQVLYGIATHTSEPAVVRGSGAGTAGSGVGTFGLFFRDSTPQLGISTSAVPLSGAATCILWLGDPAEADESFLILTNYDGAVTTMDAEFGYKNNTTPDPNWPTGMHVFTGPCVAIPYSIRTSNVSRVIVEADGDVVLANGQVTASGKFHVRGNGGIIAHLETSAGVAVLDVQSSGRADFTRSGGSNAIFVCSSTGAANIFCRNTDVTGGTGIEFTEDTGVTTKLAIGYGNASYTDALRTGKPFLWVGANATFVITDSARNYMSIDQANASMALHGHCDGSREPTAVQTTDATVTNIATYTPTADRTVLAKAYVTVRRSDDTEGAVYIIAAAFRVTSGGAVTQIGATSAISTFEDDATWACIFDTDGTLIRVRGTGAAGKTLKWTVKLHFAYGAN